MELLQTLCAVLHKFPQWDGAALTVDQKDGTPHTCQLLPQGQTVLQSREDVLGNRVYLLRQKYLLRRVTYPGQAAAQWLLALQEWLRSQKLPGVRIWAEEGTLGNSTQPGTGIYEVIIYMEYEKE